jgi:hypothetical protein
MKTYWGVETELLTREEHTLSVFQKRVPTKIFGHKKEDVIRCWRRLHNELHNLFASPYKIRVLKSRKMRWAGHVAHIGQMRNAYSSILGKHEGEEITRKTLA